MRAANEAFRAAGAFEPVDPDHRRARLGLKSVGDLAGVARAEAQPRGGQAAELEEAPKNVLNPVIYCPSSAFISISESL